MSTPLPQVSGQTTVSVIASHQALPWSYYLYCEWLKILRNPLIVLFGIGFPSLFFLLFANVFDAKYAPIILAQYASYGAFVVAFQTFSISIAMERSMHWNKLLRTTSMSTVLYVGAKFLIILLTGVLSLLVLFTVARFTGRVHMEFSRWFVLLGYMLLGMFPFAALGIFLGFIGSASLTQVFSMLFTLLLSFASGFFLPLQFLPKFVRDVAFYLPTYHLAQLAYAAVGATQSLDSHSLWIHFAFLVAYAFIFAILGVWAYIRDENRNFV